MSALRILKQTFMEKFQPSENDYQNWKNYLLYNTNHYCENSNTLVANTCDIKAYIKHLCYFEQLYRH